MNSPLLTSRTARIAVLAAFLGIALAGAMIHEFQHRAGIATCIHFGTQPAAKSHAGHHHECCDLHHHAGSDRSGNSTPEQHPTNGQHDGSHDHEHCAVCLAISAVATRAPCVVVVSTSIERPATAEHAHNNVEPAAIAGAIPARGPPAAFIG